MSSQEAQSADASEFDLALIAGRASEDVKLAHRAAVLLQQEIISGHLEGGHSIGTAAEIRARYNLGRWAFREAVAILELRGVARLRPGPGGGVVVVQPNFDDLVGLTLLYLYVKRSSHREVADARRAVLVAVVKNLLQRAPALDEFERKAAIGEAFSFHDFSPAKPETERLNWLSSLCATIPTPGLMR